jgi:hypothetical protein
MHQLDFIPQCGHHFHKTFIPYWAGCRCFHGVSILGLRQFRRYAFILLRTAIDVLIIKTSYYPKLTVMVHIMSTKCLKMTKSLTTRHYFDFYYETNC